MFVKADCSSNKSKNSHCRKLNELIFNMSLELHSIVIILDASIKNNIVISITYVYLVNNPLKKTLHHIIDIMSLEVELFVLKYRINQATQIPGSSHIIIIMDVLYVVATTRHKVQ